MLKEKTFFYFDRFRIVVHTDASMIIPRGKINCSLWAFFPKNALGDSLAFWIVFHDSRIRVKLVRSVWSWSFIRMFPRVRTRTESKLRTRIHAEPKSYVGRTLGKDEDLETDLALRFQKMEFQSRHSRLILPEHFGISRILRFENYWKKKQINLNDWF